MIWIKQTENLKLTLRRTSAVALSVIGVYTAIKYSYECTQGIKNGLALCITTLIPSLFIFLVLSQYISSGSVVAILDKLLKTPSKIIFRHSGVCTGVLIMALIGGYPVGARCIASLYKTNILDKQSASKLSLMAVCSGPGFVINFVGQALIKNKTAGAILFISQLVSCVIVALICAHLINPKDIIVSTRIKSETKTFVQSVNDGCIATVNMCAMVLVFSAIISVCDSVLKESPVLCDTICCLLEITTACNKLCTRLPLYTTSFLIGFGGICVHFQIFSALKDIGINKTLFFFMRIIQGIISGLATYILLILINPQIQVFSTTDTVVFDNASTIWGSVALILTAICFLNSIKISKHIRR